MIKFLRFKDGDLLNVNSVKAIRKDMYLVNRGSVEDGKRGIHAEIEIQATNGGVYKLIDVRAYAARKEGEPWDYDTKGGRLAVERIEDILDTMITVLVDKMNDEDEKIISIGTNFLEEAMQEEVERG